VGLPSKRLYAHHALWTNFTARRCKVVESVRTGIPKSETARGFGVNRSTVNRSGKRPKLDERAIRLFEEDLEARPWVRRSIRSVRKMHWGFFPHDGHTTVGQLIVEFAVGASSP
jgi:hypothetical protein